MTDEDRVTKPIDNAASQSERAAPPTETDGHKVAQTDVGSALRAAFRATVDEQVPDAMLDLLKRLS